VTKQQLVKDAAGNLVMPHRMNPNDGMYRGRVVVDLAAALEKKQAKKKSRAEAQKEEEKTSA